MIQFLSCGKKIRPLFAALLLLSGVGCAHSPPPAQEASPEPAEPIPSAQDTPAESKPIDEPVGPFTIPTTCAAEGEECLPDARWVKSLCQDVYPAVALYLFQKSMPFTHGYLSRRTQAVNASGGATSGSEWVLFDEEVVLLYHRRPRAGGMQIGGAEGSYDALRWDGSCVSLDSTEVRLQHPPAPKATEIPWRSLGKDVQVALKKHKPLKTLYIARKNECKGAFSGDVSRKCIRLNTQLNQKIVEVLRKGDVVLEQPKRRP